MSLVSDKLLTQGKLNKMSSLCFVRRSLCLLSFAVAFGVIGSPGGEATDPGPDVFIPDSNGKETLFFADAEQGLPLCPAKLEHWGLGLQYCADHRDFSTEFKLSKSFTVYSRPTWIFDHRSSSERKRLR